MPLPVDAGEKFPVLTLSDQYLQQDSGNSTLSNSLLPCHNLWGISTLFSKCPRKSVSVTALFPFPRLPPADCAASLSSLNRQPLEAPAVAPCHVRPTGSPADTGGRVHSPLCEGWKKNQHTEDVGKERQCQVVLGSESPEGNDIRQENQVPALTL